MTDLDRQPAVSVPPNGSAAELAETLLVHAAHNRVKGMPIDPDTGLARLAADLEEYADGYGHAGHLPVADALTLAAQHVQVARALVATTVAAAPATAEAAPGAAPIGTALQDPAAQAPTVRSASRGEDSPWPGRTGILDEYLADPPPRGWHVIDNADADDVRHNLEEAIERLRAAATVTAELRTLRAQFAADCDEWGARRSDDPREDGYFGGQMGAYGRVVDALDALLDGPAPRAAEGGDSLPRP